MKRTALRLLSFLVPALVMAACVEDAPIFTISEGDADIAFQNTFAAEYLLSDQTETNIAERFIWNTPDFGTPVNVTYELYGGTQNVYDSASLVASSTETNVGITVEQMLEFADELGLDNDPTTTDADGNPNNKGVVFFWVNAFTGSGNDSPSVLSDSVALNITVIEVTVDGGCDPIYAVGDGTQAGWDWNNPVVLNCDGDVFSAKLQLNPDGAFRFFTVNNDWGSGQNHPYYVAEGYTIDARFVDAADNDNNFKWTGDAGVYVVTVDDNAKTITVTDSSPLFLVGDGTQAGWDWGSPVVAAETSPDVFSASVTLNGAGAFRFFTVRDDWGSGLNFPYYSDAGYTIDARFINAEDGDSNFKWTGTDGTYTVTVDDINMTITVE